MEEILNIIFVVDFKSRASGITILQGFDEERKTPAQPDNPVEGGDIILYVEQYTIRKPLRQYNSRSGLCGRI